jgi:uncharacterized membrane protein YeaQ/YmgE (transglycosylase-associated protein family)
MGMALFGSRDKLALQITQRCKERDGAVADIIMGLGASVTLLPRKGALCALQSLALTLLVATAGSILALTGIRARAYS